MSVSICDITVFERDPAARSLFDFLLIKAMKDLPKKWIKVCQQLFQKSIRQVAPGMVHMQLNVLN